MLLVLGNEEILMKVTKREDLYQLAFLPNIFPVNCYLFEEEKELTLIDAALPFSAKGIVSLARKIGKPITKIVLTHAHDDHVGSLDLVREYYSESNVYISKRDARLMEGDRTLDPSEPNTPIRGGVPKKLKTRANILLNEGDRVGSLLSISTPGHTPGSMSFMDTRTKAIVTGDALQTRAGIAVAGKIQPFFPFPAFGTWNKDVAIESAEKIKAYNPSILAVGHGPMLSNPSDAIEKAITEAKRKQKQY